MTKPVVYLAGGIFQLDDAAATSWREYVKQQLAEQCEFLDPMRRDYRGREGDFAAEIVNGDKHDIRHSDIILAMAVRPSWGTAMEIEYAYERRYPDRAKIIIGIVGDGPISPWLLYHCHRTVAHTYEATALIKEIVK